jgi:hypothetical protein
MSCVCIPLHLEVVFQLLLADRAPFPEQRFHFFQGEGVPLERRGVVRFLVPDVGPDALSLLGAWKASETRAELAK